jgi:hypothetical protein
VKFNVISQGTIFHLILIAITGIILSRFQFEISEEVFTGLLVVNLFFVSAYAGFISEEHGYINGIVIGGVSALMIFAFLTKFVDQSLILNFFLFSLWLGVGCLGGLFGSKTRKRKLKRSE